MYPDQNVPEITIKGAGGLDRDDAFISCSFSLGGTCGHKDVYCETLNHCRCERTQIIFTSENPLLLTSRRSSEVSEEDRQKMSLHHPHPPVQAPAFASGGWKHSSHHPVPSLIHRTLERTLYALETPTSHVVCQQPMGR